MPVIRHHDLPGLLDDSHERVVAIWFLKQREPSDGPVEDMEHFVGGADSFCAGIPRSYRDRTL